MKTFKLTKFAAAAVMASAVAMAASHVQAADATGSADAIVVAPITITHDSATIEFGTFAPSTTAASTVLVNAAASGHTDGSGIERLASGNTPAGDSFTVGGSSGAAYAITLPTSTVVTNGTPAEDMTVNTFTHDAGGSPTITGGSVTLRVGATLQVAQNQAAGTYAGTYQVTVSYN